MKKFLLIILLTPALILMSISFAYAQTAEIQSNDGYANMYTGAGTQYAVSKRLNNGTYVAVQANGSKIILGKAVTVPGDWYFVKTESNDMGFVHKNNLKFIENASPVPYTDHETSFYYCSTATRDSLDAFLETLPGKSAERQAMLSDIYQCRPDDVLDVICENADVLQILDSQLDQTIAQETEKNLNQKDSLLFLKYRVNKCQSNL